MVKNKYISCQTFDPEINIGWTWELWLSMLEVVGVCYWVTFYIHFRSVDKLH